MNWSPSSVILSTTTHDDLRRRDAVSPLHRETTINIISWVFLALVVSTLITRFAVKLSRRSSRNVVQADDVFLLLAALFSFGQTLAITVQWRNASGERLSDLSTSKQDVFQKAAYASSILFVANMGCAKISMALVMQKLFVGRVFEYTSYILALFTAVWTVSGILVVAFQCHLPTPWDLMRKSECIDTVAFGNYLASTNIVTEIMLVLVPLAVWTQKSPIGNRLYVSAVFWSRLSIVAAITAQLYFSNTSTPTPSLPSISASTIITQLAQTLSIISACLPSLHPLIAQDLHSPNPSHSAQNPDGSHWDARKFGSLSTHTSKPSVDSTATRPLHMTFSVPPAESPYCHPLATHGLTRSPPSRDSYSFPRIPSNIALPVADLEPPQNVFNRLIRSSSSLELDPLGSRNVEDLGVLPASDWDENENENDYEDGDGGGDGDGESGRATPERRPTSEYVFERSKVISVPEEGTMFEIGREWSGFVPPLPTPKVVGEPPRAF